MPVPKDITADHVRKALKKIDAEGGWLPQYNPTKYCLYYNRKYYPPKYVLYVAGEYCGHELGPWSFAGGKPANEYLKKLGFKIVPKNPKDKQNNKNKARSNEPGAKKPIDNIIADGCFLEPEIIEEIIAQLHRKKNLILQGPPGTGKTWLARKLAYAILGQKDKDSLCAVQFHPTMSYEDFVRGWRPSGDGKLALVDGPFLEMINKARKNPSVEHVVVIEEINRGNPAQIFGEMLTLLEADKRKRDEELKLIYSKEADERIYIPENLYVIGTMNIADRSLALVDLALRRRFAFFDLEPTLGKRWRDWVSKKSGIDIPFLKDIEQRLVSLNKKISDDQKLGEQYRIGHSYVTPTTEIEDPATWFRGVVEHEIYPLLEEYLFDNLELAKKMRDGLVEGIEGT